MLCLVVDAYISLATYVPSSLHITIGSGLDPVKINKCEDPIAISNDN